MSRESLPVDLADKADVREKLPEARSILERKEAELRDLEQSVNRWRSLVSVLAEFAGEDVSEVPDAPNDAPVTVSPIPAADGLDVSSSMQPLELVVAVVDRTKAPIRARDVGVALREHGVDLDSEAVSNALYYAAMRADPPRLLKLAERGMYAPLTYRSPSLTDNPAPDLDLPASVDLAVAKGGT